jgi:trigger factor
VAGKTAQFTVTLKKIEWPHLPEVDAEFAKSLGIEDGDLTKMRADIKENLEREVKRRTQSIVKDQVMDAAEGFRTRRAEGADRAGSATPRRNGASGSRPARHAEREGRTDPGRDVRRAGRASRQAGPVLAELVKANGLKRSRNRSAPKSRSSRRATKTRRKSSAGTIPTSSAWPRWKRSSSKATSSSSYWARQRTDKEVSFEELASASAQA